MIPYISGIIRFYFYINLRGDPQNHREGDGAEDEQTQEQQN